MSIDSPVADELIDVPQHTVAPSQVAPSASRSVLRAISPLVLTAAAALIGAGVIAAIATGANPALAILVGYGAGVGTLVLARTAAPAPPVAAAPEAKSEPAPAEATTAAAWMLVSTFTVADASRLFCGGEPGGTATQESIAWGRALIDAIKRGDLAIAPKPGVAQSGLERERENPHYMTEVTREALRAWADRKGSVPDFLRP